jgi:hypothetical protein
LRAPHPYTQPPPKDGERVVVEFGDDDSQHTMDDGRKPSFAISMQTTLRRVKQVLVVVV